MAAPDDSRGRSCTGAIDGEPKPRSPRPMCRLRSSVPVRSGAPLGASRILQIFPAFEGLGFALAFARTEKLGVFGREDKFFKEPDSIRR